MDYWKARELRDKIETDGRPCVHPSYLAWVFFVRPLNGYNEHYAREMVRIGQQPFVKEYLERLASPDYVPDERQRAEDEQIDADILLEAFATGVLAGWEGVTDSDGAPMPFNRENAIALLRHFRRDLLPHMQQFAKNPVNFPLKTDGEKQAAIAGNLKRATPSKQGSSVARSRRSQRQMDGTA